MARHSGVGISATINDGGGVENLIGMTSISDSYTIAKTDATGSDTPDNWREFVANLTTGTFSMSGHYDDSIASSNTPPDPDWAGTLLTGVVLTYGVGTALVLSGAAWCDSVNIDTDIEGATDYTINCTWNGRPSES